MPSFIGDVMTAIASSASAFALEIIGNYWLFIAGLIFLGGIVGLVWGFIRRFTGR